MESARKTRSFKLEQDEGIIKGEENLKNYITDYYKNLFVSQKGTTSLLWNLWMGISHRFLRRGMRPWLLSSWKRRWEMPFSKWRITRHQVRTVSRSISIKFFGVSSRTTLWLCFEISIMRTLDYLSLISGLLCLSRNWVRLQKLSNTVTFVCLMWALKFSPRWLQSIVPCG